MAQELEVAKKRLFDKDAINTKNIKLFLGSNRDATIEEIAEQINKSLSQIDAGDFQCVNLD